MKSVLLFLTLVLSSFAVQAAETVTTITITTAQADAETMARTGILRHCGRSGGILEGIGMSSVSADAALRRCCYWGRPYREIGIARSRTGVWYAVVRYR
jgi:hypothetical protein